MLLLRTSPRTLLRSVLVLLATTLSLLALGVGSAQAKPIGPIGPPYVLDLDPTAQRSLLSGATAAPGVIVCTFTAGGLCAVSGIAVAAATPAVVNAGVCPNNADRRMHMQDVHTVMTTITGNAIPYDYAEVEDTYCLPGPS